MEEEKPQKYFSLDSKKPIVTIKRWLAGEILIHDGAPFIFPFGAGIVRRWLEKL